MNKKLFITFLILFIITKCFTQNELTDKQSFSILAGFLQETVTDTVLINGITYEILLKNGNKVIQKTSKKTGTCFFVYRNLDVYLITAEHVARNCSFNTLLAINTSDNKPYVTKLIDIAKDKNKLDWNFHPHADVAVLYLGIGKNLDRLPLIPIEMILSEFRAPKRETQLTVFGFPLSLGIGKEISAISKTSQPSSQFIETNRFDNGKLSTFYLLDDQSVSGFSGGPVINLLPEIGGVKFDLDKNPDINKVVGLVHGSIDDKKSGGGFAAIVPSKYIVETIESSERFNGVYKFKYENEKIWSEVKYKNGNPFTVISNFKQSGRLQEKGTLKNGNGTRYIYDEKGRLISIIHYQNGRIVKTEKKE